MKNSLFALLLASFGMMLPSFAQEKSPAPAPQKEELTFSMIKPRAVLEGHVGDILSILEKAGFHIRALKMKQLTPEEAEKFYAEHKGKSFFPELISKITSGPVVMFVLAKTDAISSLRLLVGATDPKKASSDTIRARFGSNVTENGIHASDSPTSADRETHFFFSTSEISKIF